MCNNFRIMLALALLVTFLSLCASSPTKQFINGTSFFGTKATRNDVIRYLINISGSYTISGQHNREPNSDPTKWTQVVRDITGVYPGLWGGDFLFLPDDVKNRQSMVDQAIRQWNSGVIVALTWHVCPPTIGETCNWDKEGILSWLNDNQWNDLITEGGNLNRLWKARLDTIVPYLKQLKNAGVVPIWRPLHEINEGWSWWGGRSGANGSRKLYQITYDYLVQYHGFDNLVWTWCVKDVDMDNIGQYWPDDDSYVDVASLDIWVKQFSSNDDYQKMLNIANGKPIALAEVGSVPSPAILQSQNRWSWFMIWAEYLKDPSFNTDQKVKDTYYLNNVLHQGDIDLGNGGDGENIAISRPVRASSQPVSNQGPEKIVDGDLSTRWSSDNQSEQWIIVDLGQSKNVRLINIYWDSAFAKGYQIQTSLDDSVWTTVYEDYNNANGDVDQITLKKSVNTKYLKLYMFDKGMDLDYSLFEIQAFI